MRPVSRRFVVISLALLGLSSAGLAMAQEKSDPKPAPKVRKAAQRVEGVIVKVEPFAILAADPSKFEENPAGEKEPTTRYELTINTAVPWEDYVRDEAVNPDKAAVVPENPANKAKPAVAPKVKESVAVEGQPSDPATETCVNLTPSTKIELRYRSSTDESDDGAPTVKAAEDLQKDPADESASDSKTKTAAVKPLALKPEDLRVGQYVIVEYGESPAEKPATSIIVLKPIGGADTSATDEEQKSAKDRKKP
jgi:hypothetical protein